MAFVLLVASVAFAQSDAPALVRRLGDQSFTVREAAEAELSALGLAARAALETGVRDADVEIRARCERLLARVHEADRMARVRAFLDDKEDRPATALPGWLRFRSLVTPTPTRQAYVPVYEAESALLDLTTREPKQAADRLAERTRELGRLLLLTQRDKETLAALPTWLLMAGDPEVPVAPATLEALYSGLLLLSRREAVRKQFLATPGGPELLLTALQRGGAATHALTVPLAGELQLPAAKAWGLQLATNPATPAATRAQGILLVARVGGPPDIPALVPLLTDTTPIGTVTVAGVRINAELRDVALAALVHLRGEPPASYGFPYFEAIPGLKALPSPERLGFTDTASRDKAFAKWRSKP